MLRLLAALALWAGAAALVSDPAPAHWPSGASDAAAATRATSMPTGSQPSASVSNRSVAVSWAKSSLPGDASVSGYEVRRYSAGGTLQSIGAGCAGTISGLSCTETSVPSGDWRYAVVPKHHNWRGDESPRSATASVATPALTLSSSTVTNLPGTLSGTIAGYLPGQTLAYRLDSATTGTVLAGTTTPTPVQASGGASISVTVPSGTSTGAHTLYAIGSAGDVASATFTVSQPVSTTFSTPAFDIRDASAGTGEVDSSWQLATADGRTLSSGLWANAFGSRYIEFEMNDPLPAGQPLSDAAFNFRFAAGAAGNTACIYFEVRRISTGAIVNTHGSASQPAHCVTGTTQQTFATNLPLLTSTTLANDVRIRMYARESGARAIAVDTATVTGSTGSTPFTLYPMRATDATGTPTTTPWGPAAGGDGAAYTGFSNWASSFSAARYLRLALPAYVPAGATVTGATFENHYRPTSSGRNACWYAEIYAGANLIRTVGSSASPISCNSSTAYATDSISLPEVSTPAQANSLSVRAYYNISGGGTRTTQHDLLRLTVSYTQ